MPVYREGNAHIQKQVAGTPVDIIQQALVILDQDPRYKVKEKSYSKLVKIINERHKADQQAMTQALQRQIESLQTSTGTQSKALQTALKAELKNLKKSNVNPLVVADRVFNLLNDPVSTIAEKVPLIPGRVKDVAIAGYGVTTGVINTVGLFSSTAIPLSGTAGAVLAPSTTLMTAAGVGSLSPLTMVLAPLCGITSVALMAGQNMALKELLQKPEFAKAGHYFCSCGTCKDALEFIIDRSDGFASRIAITATVVGALPVALYTAGRKIKNKLKGTASEKHQKAKNLWDHARTEGTFTLSLTKEGFVPNIRITKTGCPLATVIIAVLFGEFATGSSFTKTMATIAAIDGIDKIKDEIK